MNNETKKTETLIQIYKEDPVRDNLRALVHQMRKTRSEERRVGKECDR